MSRRHPRRSPIDGFYSIIDGAYCDTPAACSRFVTQLYHAGSRTFQLRVKQAPDCERLSLAQTLVAQVRQLPGAISIINDRCDLAMVAGADGVHLGQDDLTVADARQLLGPDAVIGLSTHSLVQARDALRSSADYLGFGPVFATQTKANAEPAQGLERLQQVVQLSDRPVVAIGGINAGSVAAIWQTGVHAVAAIAAVLSASDVAHAVSDLLSQRPQSLPVGSIPR